jgi:hypothetical protein
MTQVTIEQATPPTFVPDYSGLLVTSGAPNAVVEYIADSGDWTPVTGPLRFNQHVHLKARVRQTGRLTSPVVEYRY